MKIIAASFRDPAGTVFTRDGVIFRTISASYRNHYEHLFKSGLYQALTGSGALIPHEEVPALSAFPAAYKIIRPEQLDLITYPQEWCFSQLKEAALLTLRIQLKALEYGMILKDASPYNVQFRGNRAIWIDTLSFEIYTLGEPWIAYRQFCEQFFAPLVIMSLKDISLSMLRMFPAGLPLSIAIKLMPWYSRLRSSIFLNIILHHKMQRREESRSSRAAFKQPIVSKQALMGHAEMLLRTVSRMKPAKRSTQEWSGYYEETQLQPGYLAEKDQLITDLLKEIKPERVLDLGANTGRYSHIAKAHSKVVIALEKDPQCLEDLFRKLQQGAAGNIIPLSFDIMEPAPTAGWEANERLPLWERYQPDLVLALAVLHHLSIKENVPYRKISSLLAKMGTQVIIEYVPPEDPNAAKMLQYKSDLAGRISQDSFLLAFREDWVVVKEIRMNHSARILYHMKLKQHV